MAQDWTQTTRALKAVVIVLGVIIVLGAAVIAVEIVRRAGDLVQPAPERFATTTVPLAADARIVGMTGEGDAISLLVEAADGRQRVITIDRRTGAVLGTLTFEPPR